MTILKSTYTTSRLSTGWGRSNQKIFIALFLVIAIGCLLLAISYWNSISASSRERITIGVYGPIPYVISFDRKDAIATIVYFDPRKAVNMPGQYSWYKISSVNYLGEIEHKQSELISGMFEQLVGVPVDMVIYPKRGELLEYTDEEFYTYFARTRMRQSLLYDGFTSSVSNLFDRYEMIQILMTQNNQLLIINGNRNQYGIHTEAKYEAEKLDTFLKGYFYQETLVSSQAKVIVHVTKKQFKAALRFSRLLEGLGQKVHSIEVEKERSTVCILSHGRSELKVAQLLLLYMPEGCRKVEKKANDIIIDMYFDDRFVGIYT